MLRNRGTKGKREATVYFVLISCRKFTQERQNNDTITENRGRIKTEGGSNTTSWMPTAVKPRRRKRSRRRKRRVYLQSKEKSLDSDITTLLRVHDN